MGFALLIFDGKAFLKSDSFQFKRIDMSDITLTHKNPLDLCFLDDEWEYRHIPLPENPIKKFLMVRSIHQNNAKGKGVFSIGIFGDWLIMKHQDDCESLNSLLSLLKDHKVPVRHLSCWQDFFLQQLSAKKPNLFFSNTLLLVVFQSHIFKKKTHFFLVYNGKLVFSRFSNLSKKSNLRKEVDDTLSYIKRLPFVSQTPTVLGINVGDELRSDTEPSPCIELTLGEERKLLFKKHLFPGISGVKTTAPNLIPFKNAFKLAQILKFFSASLASASAVAIAIMLNHIEKFQHESDFFIQKTRLLPKTPKHRLPDDLESLIQLGKRSQRDLNFLAHMHAALYQSIAHRAIISQINYKTVNQKPLKKSLQFIVQPLNNASQEREWWAQHLRLCFNKFKAIPQIHKEQQLIRVSLP